MIQKPQQFPPEQGDGDLLAQFVEGGQQGAFAAIVNRHGCMVLAVCRARLGNTSDAEDAAQAVFLTLAYRASSLKGRNTVVGWLHQVAWYTATRACEAASIRRRHEQEAARMRPEVTHATPEIPLDQFHEALEKLPEKYRVPLLLHHLEGRTEEETAALMGCTLAAASTRLSRGRQMLRERLLRGGTAVTAIAVMAALSGKVSAAVPAAFVNSTVNIAASVIAGKTATTTASATVTALSKGALNMLWIAKMKLAAAIMVLIVIVCGTGLYVASAAAAGTAAPPNAMVPISPAATSKAPSTLTAIATQSAPATKGKGIHFAKGPDNGEALIAARLKGPLGPLGAGFGDPATVKIGPALPFWRIDLKDVVAGGGLEKAFFYDPGGAQQLYHYLLENGGKGVGSSDVLVDTAAGTARLNGMSGQNDSDSIVQGLNKLSALPEVKNGSFEVRYLNSGVILGSGPTLVVWLKADDGGKDLIYICSNGYVSPNSPLEAEKVYTADDYLKIIRPMAARRAGNAAGAPATSRP